MAVWFTPSIALVSPVACAPHLTSTRSVAAGPIRASGSGRRTSLADPPGLRRQRHCQRIFRLPAPRPRCVGVNSGGKCAGSTGQVPRARVPCARHTDGYRKLRATVRICGAIRCRNSDALVPVYGAGLRWLPRHTADRLRMRRAPNELGRSGSDQYRRVPCPARVPPGRPVSGPTRTHFGPSGTLICFGPSVALRLPASAASDEAFCAGSPGDLRRAGRERRGRALARFPCRRGRIRVVVPRIPNSFAGSEADSTQRVLLENLLAIEGVRRPVLYYFTPLALRFSAISARRWWCMTAWTSSPHLRAPRRIRSCWSGLSSPAPISSLPAASASSRPSATSIRNARLPQQRRCRSFRTRPSAALNHGIRRRCRGPPRLLRRHRRAARPRADRCGGRRAPGVAHLVMVGPVVKIDPAVLPKRANIHWLGPKLYEELPLYLGGWDVALCRSHATRRPASSVRPRRRSTWPPAARSSRPQSLTWCAATAKPGWRGSPPLRTNSWFSARRRCATRSRPAGLSGRSLARPDVPGF